MKEKTLFLVDATAFCYRAFYAIRNLATSYGQPTNAVYGFVMMLKKLIDEQKPEYLAICFDVSRDTFRQKKFADYKIQRPGMPDELSSQMPLIREVIQSYNMKIIEKEGFEADDCIATLNRIAKEKNWEVLIVSSDKDILQLVDEHTKVFNPYKEEGFLYDVKRVKERFGVKPENIPEVISLMGDSVDNIPGIPGIGEKTAVKLISEFKTTRELIANLERVKQDKIRQAIVDNLKVLTLNHELALLDSHVPLKFALTDLKLSEPDYNRLFEIFKRLEFRGLLASLPIKEDSFQEIATLQPKGDEDYKRLVKELKSKKELVIFYDENNPLSIYIAFNKNEVVYCQKLKEIEEVFSDKTIKKTGHDLKQIKTALNRKGILLEGLEFDTMLAAYILDSSKNSYALEDLSLEYLDISPSKQGLSAAEKITLVYRLKDILEKKIKELNLEKIYYDLELPLLDVLADMELEGVAIATKVLSGLSKDLETRLAKLIAEIFQYSGGEFNINSPKQLSQVLFERLKLPVIKKTKTGASTDEEVLNKLAGKHKLPAKLLEYRQLTKLKSTYIDALPKLIDPQTGKIHTSFNQTGTETGRLSSSEPNLQNIPIKTEIGRQIRRAFIPSSKENLILSSDYSQIELRVLAHLSSDKNLISAFKEDKDIHRFTASLIFNQKQEDVTNAMRETAKRINFGIIYGMSAFGLAKDLNISQEEAQNFIDAYFMRYPKVKEFLERQIKLARSQLFVATLMGRRRYIPNIDSKNNNLRQFAERQAVNAPVQGSAADLIKLAMINIHRELNNKGFQARMVLQVHDELVFDVPKKEITQLQELVKDQMEDVLKLDVPIKVDIKVGENWLEIREVK